MDFMQTIYCCFSEVYGQLNSKFTPAVKINNFMVIYILHIISFSLVFSSVVYKYIDLYSISEKDPFTAYVGNVKIPNYHSETKTMFSMDLISLNHNQILKTFKINI